MKTEIDNSDEIQLLLSDCRGINIPKDFYSNFNLEKWHIQKSEWYDNLLDNKNENYWEAWQDILDKAFYLDNGKKWTLYQNGDLFAISEKYIWEEN